MAPAWLRGRSRQPHRRHRNGVPSDETSRPRPSDHDRAAPAARARHLQRQRRRRHHARAGAAGGHLQAGVLYPARGRRHDGVRAHQPFDALPLQGRRVVLHDPRRRQLAENAIWSYEHAVPGDGGDFRTAWRSIRTASTRSKKAEHISLDLLVPTRSGASRPGAYCQAKNLPNMELVATGGVPSDHPCNAARGGHLCKFARP